MKIGLIAGGGSLPIAFAQSVKNQNKDLIIIAIKDIASPELEKYGKVFWIDLGHLGELIKILKENNVTDLVMLGKIEHDVLLFQLDKFDQRMLQFLAKLEDKRAESILGSLIKELEDEGFKFINPLPLMAHLFAKEGLINNIQPEDSQIQDAKFGLKIAKAEADLDVGQSVVVKDGIVIAVEAIEGTDKCILRGGELGGEGTVVCKVARSKQDMRFDVPVVGLNTLESMKKAKAKFLAIEAGKTFLLDKEEFIKKADEYGISVMGFSLEKIS